MRIYGKLIFIWAIAMAYVGSTNSVIAEENHENEGATQLINVFEALVEYPAPIWSKGGNPLDQSEFYKNQNGSRFVLEQIPKGDSFDNWNQLYAISGDYIKLEQDVPLDAYISASLEPFVNVCGKDRMWFKKLYTTQTSTTLFMGCEDSPKAPEGSGYGNGIGEIALFHFSKVNNTFVKVYHEWRGKSFSGDNPEAWPVKFSDLETMIQRFRAIRVSEY